MPTSEQPFNYGPVRSWRVGPFFSQRDNKMMKRLLGACAVVALLSWGVAAQDTQLIGKGHDLTVKNRCAVCHVITGKGGKIAKPLDGVAARLDAAAIRRILTDPQKELPDAKVKMPKIAWAPGDIDAVIAYLQSLK